MMSTETATMRDQHYVLDLCDELLGERGLREHRFAWLVGDPGRDGRRRTLPVDAYYPERALVVEYHESQHRKSVALWNKPTISGVSRDEQRRRYDRRRELEIPRHGLRLLEIRSDQLVCDKRERLLRNRKRDRETLAALLVDFRGDAASQVDPAERAHKR